MSEKGRPCRARITTIATNPFLSYEERANLLIALDDTLSSHNPSRDAFSAFVVIAKAMMNQPFADFLKSGHYRAYVGYLIPSENILSKNKIPMPKVYGINFDGDLEAKEMQDEKKC